MATPTTDLTLDDVQKLLNGPAGTPPVGVTPNFGNPPNLNTVVFVTAALCVLFATLAVSIRMYTKLFLIQWVAYEDYAVMIGWIGLVAYASTGVMTTRYGCGFHIWDVRNKEYFKMLYWVNVCAIIYFIVIFFVKLSILLQYLRIFRPTRQVNALLFFGVHVCMWTIFLFSLVSTIFVIIICIPREKIWNPLLATGHCFNTDVINEASGIFNTLSDFTILLLPMPTVWQLNVPIRKKIGIFGVFSAGLFACVTSILRTNYTWKIIHSGDDITYNFCRVGLWTFAEMSIGIIVCCLPISPRFFQFLGPKISACFSFRSKSNIKIDANPDTGGSNKHLRATKFERPFTKSNASGAWNGTHSNDAHSEYSNLDENGIPSKETQLASDSVSHTLKDSRQVTGIVRTTEIDIKIP